MKRALTLFAAAWFSGPVPHAFAGGFSSELHDIRATVLQNAQSRPAQPPAVRPDFPAGDPVQEGLDPKALQDLLDRAEAEHSDAVLVLRHGRLVASAGTLDRKIMAMSTSKSIASLAIGLLIEEGRIKSLDQPISDFIPEWKQGDKSFITVRMLLNHTSGLNTRGRGVPYALQAPQAFFPGTAFAYNNPAVDLLAYVIQEASGRRADLYIAERLFEPLGITDWDWMKDAGGYPMTAGELEIRPIDLAKIGQMVLNGGVWKGIQVVPKDWLTLSVEPSQPFEPTCGLLWWRDAERRSIGVTPRLYDAWVKAGIPVGILEPLRPLLGKAFRDVDQLRQAFLDAYKEHREWLQEVERRWKENRMQAFETLELGPMRNFAAIGWLGQLLVISPDKELVAVRMRQARDSDYPTPQNPAPPYVDAFEDFQAYVNRLVPSL
jgi:CubicO group peptidase (beta-lactamase class C family)